MSFPAKFSDWWGRADPASTLALALLKLLSHTGAKANGRIVLLGQDLASYSDGKCARCAAA